MVQTRRQYNRWVDERGEDYQTSQSTCSDCSQRSEASQHDNDFAHEYQEELNERNGPSYRPNDHCKRHRNRDNDPYTEEVTTYRRRKPIR